jgi:hypothetical protein
MGLWLGVDLWRSYPVLKGLGVKYSFHWVLRGRREASRGARGVVVVRKKQFGRYACGSIPACGSKVGPSARLVFGTAEAVPYRVVVALGDDG